MNHCRTRTCEICSAEYQPTYSDQRTCGRACGVELRRAENGTAGSRPGRNCRRCGKWSADLTRQLRTCRECVTLAIAPRACDVCSKTFTPSSRTAKRCSADCARRAANKAALAYVKQRYHADTDFRDRMLAAAHARRADKLGMGDAKILLSYLISRDHGKCGICRKPVRARKGPTRPSIDHIIPLSQGGTHELANVQLAHYRCNLSKNNRGGGEQLLLVG